MGMVGTMLLGLHDTSDAKFKDKPASMVVYEGHTNSVRDDNDGVALAWQAPLGAWCAFYPDRAHEVLPLTSGQRITMAFKVYSVSDDLPNDPLPPVTDVAAKNGVDEKKEKDSDESSDSEDEKPAKKGAKRGQKATKKSKPKKEKKEKKTEHELKFEAMERKRKEQADLIGKRLVSLTYELASKARTLTATRDLAYRGNDDVTIAEAQAKVEEIKAKEAAEKAERTRIREAKKKRMAEKKRAATKTKGGRGTRANAKQKKEEKDALAEELANDSDGDLNIDGYNSDNSKDVDEDHRKWIASHRREMKVAKEAEEAAAASPKALQLGLVLKNFYSLFPGELKGGIHHSSLVHLSAYRLFSQPTQQVICYV
jgi:hypothetical protein